MEEETETLHDILSQVFRVPCVIITKETYFTLGPCLRLEGPFCTLIRFLKFSESAYPVCHDRRSNLDSNLGKPLLYHRLAPPLNPPRENTMTKVWSEAKLRPVKEPIRRRGGRGLTQAPRGLYTPAILMGSASSDVAAQSSFPKTRPP